ncbi:orotidine-5'-phosphate decarboxylase [Leucothrix pacifica]|uniref:Orotidine 5'-phosphate decarboxylase n=1 Tax=Leucothrix pacifica TaxID=1247513 RepID=A0A317CRZ8_9GAMM|nr:orotidine-5'-phosphate decarboxylase [Leucothrix pacifica]PWR00314.1 orotidine-5'-phosphate decarboxylase [Leucothrix pacifica]
MSEMLIVALDFPTADQALHFIEPLSPDDCILKVGLQLYVASGPQFVKRLVDSGFKVFLDLKFHDIPNTVAGACQSAADLGVWMMNVHAGGGPVMLDAAAKSLASYEKPPILIAVTVLTSMNQAQLGATGVSTSPEAQVKRLAALTAEQGLDGVVCSAQESAMLREQQGQDFVLVTPGIRPLGSEQGDQQRIMTPQDAKQAGSSYIVVGRPITAATNPLAVIKSINDSLR